MPSLNVDLSYFEHPKTRRLIGILGDGADLYPIRLWAYVGRVHASDGKLAGYSADEVESIVGWKGEKGALVSALISVGMLHGLKNGFKIHDWEEHEGHIVSFTVRAKKGAKARWGKGKRDMLQASSNLQTSNASSNALPNPTQPPNPTQLTNPTNPAKHSNGSGGSFAHGEGKGRAGSGQGDIADATAKLEVQSLLASVHVNHAVQTQLLGRRDVTPAKVRGLIEKIRQDPAVSDIGAVLVHRLNGRGKA